MRYYRNTITGVVIRVRSEVKGDWEEIPDPLAPVEKPKPKPRKPRAKKTTKK